MRVFNFILLTTFLCTQCIWSQPAGISKKTGWHIVWADDFKGTAIDTNYWHVYSKSKGWGSEKYRPGQVTVANSICTFTAVKEGNDYWSGGLTNTGK